jgi:hypothetical protein
LVYVILIVSFSLLFFFVLFLINYLKLVSRETVNAWTKKQGRVNEVESRKLERSAMEWATRGRLAKPCIKKALSLRGSQGAFSLPINYVELSNAIRVEIWPFVILRL